MSRIARKPLKIPAGVEFKQNEKLVTVKGPKGELSYNTHEAVIVTFEGDVVNVKAQENHDLAKPMVGTTRVLLENMVTGVSQGFEKKLQLVGVGYRAKVQGKALDLNLGFSHPVRYPIPDGITIETPSNTDVIVKGADKQKVGQVSAEIRELRPPESYKGKGVRYADERIVLKETKKK
jgi:large subunit ribosomal protein L6